MPEWVPFWPLMTVPYLLMLIVPWLAAYSLKEQKDFFQYLLAVSLSFLAIAGIWYLFPTEMTRPPTPDGALYQIHRELVAIDNPVCIVPCGHVIGPLIIVCLLARENRGRLFWMLPLLALGMVSIATSWQHRPVDILVGTLITLSAFALSQAIFGKLRQG